MLKDEKEKCTKTAELRILPLVRGGLCPWVCVCVKPTSSWMVPPFIFSASLTFPLYFSALFLSALSNIASGSLSPLSFQQKLTAFGFTSQEYWLLFSASAISQPISHLSRSFSLYYFKGFSSLRFLKFACSLMGCLDVVPLKRPSNKSKFFLSFSRFQYYFFFLFP